MSGRLLHQPFFTASIGNRAYLDQVKEGLESQTRPERPGQTPGKGPLWRRLLGRVWGGCSRFVESCRSFLERPGEADPLLPLLRYYQEQQRERGVETSDVLVLLRREPAKPQEWRLPAGSNIRIVTIRPEDFEVHRNFEARPVESGPSGTASPASPTTPDTPQSSAPPPDLSPSAEPPQQSSSHEATDTKGGRQ